MMFCRPGLVRVSLCPYPVRFLTPFSASSVHTLARASRQAHAAHSSGHLRPDDGVGAQLLRPGTDDAALDQGLPRRREEPVDSAALVVPHSPRLAALASWGRLPKVLAAQGCQAAVRVRPGHTRRSRGVSAPRCEERGRRARRARLAEGGSVRAAGLHAAGRGGRQRFLRPASLLFPRGRRRRGRADEALLDGLPCVGEAGAPE